MTDVDVFRDAEYIADVLRISLEDDSEGDSPAGTGPLSAQDRSRVRKGQSTAKNAFIDRLLRDLDILIYCQLSALYYMDCSVVLFAIRAAVQLIFFTPKASPFEPTRNQPFVTAILGSNLFCILFHAFIIRPEAGEATRGYLHGGLFIDFIGQKPVPTFQLISFDVLILLVDFLMLGLIIERVKTAALNPPSTSTTTNNAASANANTGTDAETDGNGQTERQDHDAEERGVMRGAEETDTTDSNNSETGVSTTPPVVDIDDDFNDERTTLLADPDDNAASRDGHPLDSFSSGVAVIMEMGLFTTIRDQWMYSTTPRRPAGYVPSTETATFLRQRFGLQVGSDGRIVRVNA
ncbi:hypothetical protein N7466_005501 [Penicillium verhagenii]|uniref:uncharacterized protein n=1 Tax=Penicillium verhagenii TaxID=1562060 RepID=UPI0025455365|nr:uncharacterized protein N7466_005501 [Penicillium verhagenii]KAJ5930008.1 hypothetical protein N7466_005501 [Penicillium verhagenii]